ncbi:MAG: DUF2225 domain-containing protein [Candidatus Mcinerneyibacterium aminivorans]|uniref:DUF2225 domain-containing protein n=1 Tax=Candidatus Mcinerneyibacterium aminivorans TaxID=2703815 RepID=A0A5D0MJ01_9BACT|nr:MAG: DUF2225 domain-containing protein [Candidatus Mcinerneyibacterium aminivorans]
MKIYSIDVKCPICGSKFKGEVLTDYKIGGYRLDFKPKFEEKDDLLHYYIWFCNSCHFSGYDDKFNYEYNTVNFSEKIKKKIRNLEKNDIDLFYKFYRAGQIAQILKEDEMSIIDYYLKSYWIAKDKKKENSRLKSSQKILTLSESILKNSSNYDFEDIFVSRYLMGYINYEMDNFKKATFHFLDLVKMKHIPQKYKKYLNFAMKILEEYENDNGFKA